MWAPTPEGGLDRLPVPPSSHALLGFYSDWWSSVSVPAIVINPHSNPSGDGEVKALERLPDLPAS